MLYSDEELERLIHDANERAHDGRLERLRFLFSLEDSDPVPVGALAYEYYQEARLCWYVGAFVAAIVMSQLALEEMLRAHYRMAKGVAGELNDHKRVNAARFYDLINQAGTDGLLTSAEAAALHRLRKDHRNPYVHPSDVSAANDLSGPSFLRQHTRIAAPELVGTSTEDEARESIRRLVTLLPNVMRRCWGMA